MRRTPLLFALVPLIACNPDYNLGEKNDGVNENLADPDPDIDVTPLEVDFGKLAVIDAETVSETVTIANVGEGDLHILSIELDSAESNFEVGAVGSVLVPAGSQTELAVSYTPSTAAADEDTVLITSDDPDEPVVEVLLLGEGIAPIIEVDPLVYDFGTMYIGCELTQPLTVSNVGTADLVIESFSANTASTDLLFDAGEDLNGPLPWTLAPGGSLEVWVDYAPLDEYSDIQYLTVTSNDPLTPSLMATQSGLGALYGDNTDIFEQPINGSTDILFAVDWSCSMYDDLGNVETNFNTFITTLAGMDADYHVAVVTADDGCFAGSDNYLDNTMSADEQSTIFSTQLNGSYGSNTERAFMLMEAAVKSSNIGSGGCNEGFYREDATLSLVGVTDEVEQSVNPYTYYVSLFQSLKSDPDDVIIHAIAGDYPGGCGSAEPGVGLYEATVATGGTFLSICATDFGSHLEILAENSTADLSAFELTDIPVEQTIEVLVDGIAVTSGWAYNASTNTVDFEADYVPQGGSTIEVSYVIPGDCEG